MLRAGEGENERAVGLLALCLSQPATPRWFPEQHALFAGVMSELESELSERDFNAARERGKSLNLETVVEELLEEFEEEN